MKLNKEWHLANKTPKNPTLEQRIEWHINHKKNCDCRDIPCTSRQYQSEQQTLGDFDL